MPKIKYHRDPGFYPLDPRENDPTKCFKLFSGGFAEGRNSDIIAAGGARSGTMVATIPFNEGGGALGDRSADITSHPTYGRENASFIRFTAKNTGTVCRSWITDRWLPLNGQVFFGRFEMETTVRCRFFIRDGNATDICPRIGFSGGHQDFTFDASPNGLSQAGCFTVSKTETTWRTHSSADLGLGAGVQTRRVDTGIRADEWHTLRVWVSAKGDEIVYSIDGVVVDRVTDPTFIATSPAIVGVGDGMSGGAVLRGQGVALTNQPQLDIEWCLVRMFMDR